jgi:hypothetical protein
MAGGSAANYIAKWNGSSWSSRGGQADTNNIYSNVGTVILGFQHRSRTLSASRRRRELGPARARPVPALTLEQSILGR